MAAAEGRGAPRLDAVAIPPDEPAPAGAEAEAIHGAPTAAARI